MKKLKSFFGLLLSLCFGGILTAHAHDAVILVNTVSFNKMPFSYTHKETVGSLIKRLAVEINQPEDSVVIIENGKTVPKNILVRDLGGGLEEIDGVLPAVHYYLESAPPRQYAILVSRGGGAWPTLSIPLMENDTVKDLKNQISESTKANIDHITIYFADKELGDDHVLSKTIPEALEYSIYDKELAGEMLPLEEKKPSIKK